MLRSKQLSALHRVGCDFLALGHGISDRLDASLYARHIIFESIILGADYSIPRFQF